MRLIGQLGRLVDALGLTHDRDSGQHWLAVRIPKAYNNGFEKYEAGVDFILLYCKD